MKRAFPGRVIFDHLPKTAGQAVNSWLSKTLGKGVVTRNLIGSHRELIQRYGGLYSVISAHVHFHDGEGLDPKYSYMTCLRSPLDRVVSWLYFVVNNHTEAQLPELLPQVRNLLENPKGPIPDALRCHISNVYVNHFSRILGTGQESEEVLLANSMKALAGYDVVGTYDNMPDFLAGVASLIGIPAPEQLDRVNVTKKRPQVEQASPELLEMLTRLNQLDLRLYEEAQAIAAKSSAARKNPVDSTQTIPWQKRDSTLERVVLTGDLLFGGAKLREPSAVPQGQLVVVDVEFTLQRQVEKLEMGFHVLDVSGNTEFGTNSSLLGQEYGSLAAGKYRVSHYFTADLPLGQHVIGYAFSETGAGAEKQLFWKDSVTRFSVVPSVQRSFAGTSYLPASISLAKIG